jgi:hypothetical protein
MGDGLTDASCQAIHEAQTAFATIAVVSSLRIRRSLGVFVDPLEVCHPLGQILWGFYVRHLPFLLSESVGIIPGIKTAGFADKRKPHAVHLRVGPGGGGWRAGFHPPRGLRFERICATVSIDLPP